MLVPYPKGDYSFLRGISPYSAGVRADAGFEIVHVRLHKPVPLNEGFSLVEQHIKTQGRTVHALCGMQLRSPRPFTFEGFRQFNAEYVAVLKNWNLVVDDENPVARTNIAPEISPPTVPSLYAFSYTIPSNLTRSTFVVAGAGELPEGSLDPAHVVRLNDSSPEALRDKIRFVMKLMSARLEGLGVNWNAVSTTNIYTVQPICSMVADEVIRPMVDSAVHGITWHYSRPPIVTIEYEMDLRGVAREHVL
jgi:hypothetical protein